MEEGKEGKELNGISVMTPLMMLIMIAEKSSSRSCCLFINSELKATSDSLGSTSGLYYGRRLY